MKLYHGSKYDLENISNNIPSKGSLSFKNELELQDGIYLTPDYGFAIAMASRPNGNNHIDITNKIAEFENFDLFNPDKNVYIYTFNTDDIPKDKIKYIDKIQCVLIGENKLIPIKKEILKAGELLKYYKVSKLN